MTSEEVKKRQSKVSSEGNNKESEVKNLLLTDENIKKRFKIGKPDILHNREDIKIDYGCCSKEIDADICIVRRKDEKLVCVVSVKKSFRERGAQTAYWSLKVKESEKDFKYILVTPDVDNEIYNDEHPEKKNKWRVILPYECDAVFVYKETEGVKGFKENNFFVGSGYLLDYIKSLT